MHNRQLNDLSLCVQSHVHMHACVRAHTQTNKLHTMYFQGFYMLAGLFYSLWVVGVKLFYPRVNLTRMEHGLKKISSLVQVPHGHA